MQNKNRIHKIQIQLNVSTSEELYIDFHKIEAN